MIEIVFYIFLVCYASCLLISIEFGVCVKTPSNDHVQLSNKTVPEHQICDIFLPISMSDLSSARFNFALACVFPSFLGFKHGQ